MNILLNIPEEILKKYQEQAFQETRSRKNLMEKVLIDYFKTNKPITLLKEKLKEIYVPNKVTIQDLSNQQPKTNYSINTEDVEETKKRILELEQQIRNPPKNTVISQKVWIAVREQELNNLKSTLPPQ